MQEVEAVKTAQQRSQIEAQLSERGQIYTDICKIGVKQPLFRKALFESICIIVPLPKKPISVHYLSQCPTSALWDTSKESMNLIVKCVISTFMSD